MAIKGVLFDFSGTIFRIESAASWGADSRDFAVVC